MKTIEQKKNSKEETKGINKRTYLLLWEENTKWKTSRCIPDEVPTMKIRNYGKNRIPSALKYEGLWKYVNKNHLLNWC